MSEKLSHKVKVHKETLPFSAYTPNYKFSIIKALTQSSTESDAGHTLPDVLNYDQLAKADRIGEDYNVGIYQLRDEFNSLKEQQDELYSAMLELSVVETRFPQPERKQNVILYVIDAQSPELIRAEKDILSPISVTYERSEYKINMHPSNLTRKFSLEANAEDANVYLVSHPSDNIDSRLVIDHVISKLTSDYMKLHPLCSIEPMMRRAGRCGPIGEVMVISSNEIKPSKDSIIYKMRNGAMFGVMVHGDIPEKVLNELLKQHEIFVQEMPYLFTKGGIGRN